MPGLVLLSILISATCAGLALRVSMLSTRLSRPRDRWIGHLSGGLCLGVGTWAMHFIGTLAWHVWVDSRFSLGSTIASMLPGVAGGVGLLRWMQHRRDAIGDALGGMVWTLSVLFLHVAGMAAWHVDAALRIHPERLPVLLLIGATLPWLSLRVWRWMKTRDRCQGRLACALGGLALGGSAAALHFVAMWATAIVGVVDALHMSPPGDEGTWLLSLGIGSTVVLSALLAVLGMVLMVLREQSLQLRQLQAASDTFLRTAVDAVLVIDATGHIRRVNTATERLFGWSEAELSGQSLHRLMRQDDAQVHDSHIERHLRTGESRIVGTGREVVGVHRDGHPMALRLAVGRAEVDGVTFFVGLLTDIRLEKALQAQREHELNHDLLTGLLNRRALFDRLPGLLQAASASQRELAVIYIDLDGFKGVNDSQGHEAGDKVLSTSAERMRGVVRDDDLVVRLGGDEFLIVMGDLPAGGQEVRRVAEALLRVLCLPVALPAGRTARIGASLGIARCSPATAPTQLAQVPDWLIRHGDDAMYVAKRAGKGRWHEVACPNASPAIDDPAQEDNAAPAGDTATT
ncbi:diguanylate cyclase [Ideonella sp. DXS22W]|uniref:Diguanylate cyclase n=1 Tax=Pseudaquabacterium inlustre TaxID=2984192 RepID=A0ABU9CJI4_9BURK